jgi:8-oxo-dGTP diphosphatase
MNPTSGCMVASQARHHDPSVGLEEMKKQPRISARACIRRNGSLLLSKYKDHRGFWYVMPGGGQRTGETLQECLVREVREELCVSVTVGNLMYIREIIADRHEDTNLPDGFHQVEVFFECSLPAGSEPELGKHPDSDQIGHEWVETERLTDILFFPIGIADRVTHPDLNGQYLGEMR